MVEEHKMNLAFSINIIVEEGFSIYAIQYYRDTFTLASIGICTLEDEDGYFLELNRLEGDGFVFSDVLMKNLMPTLEEHFDTKAISLAPEIDDDDTAFII